MNSRMIKIVLSVCLVVATIAMTGCGEKKALLELQGRYDELQKNNDELNEKYMQLYSDYEKLKAESEKTSNESKYYEPLPGCEEITIQTPQGDFLKYSTEKEKFKILEQMQKDFDKRQTSDNQNVISLDDLNKNEDLINQYYMLSGWGPRGQ